MLFLALCALTAAAQQPQGPMTDQKIVNLAYAGLSADELVRVITQAPETSFDLTPAALDGLAKAGVSDQVIQAMAAKQEGVPVRAVSPRPVASTRSLAVTSKPRVYIENSPNSWSYERGGGSHPQRAEIMKTFGQSCRGVTVTNDPKQADYVVSFEREAHKWIRKDNKFVVFNGSGDMVYAASTRALGNAVRGFCASIQ